MLNPKNKDQEKRNERQENVDVKKDDEKNGTKDKAG